MPEIKFEKISFKQFVEDWKKLNDEDNPNLDSLQTMYAAVKLPGRSTKGSAGYDFFIPFDVNLSKGESIMIPTCIRALMPENVVLMIFPRSGQGSKFRLMIMNTVGIIDSDYSGAANEGHIMIKVIHVGFEENVLMKTVPFVNDIKKTGRTKQSPAKIHIEAGQAFAQGIFLDRRITDNDAEISSDTERTGGYGSTDK